MAQQAVMNMQLPAGRPQIGPPPQINPWKKVVVGYPLWVWTDDPAQMDQTVTAQGITLTLSARRSSTLFKSSDGQQVRCPTTTRWHQGVPPMAKSPTCGLAFERVGNHTITAESTWQVTWAALGQTGVIPVTRSANTVVPVTELQAVNVGSRP